MCTRTRWKRFADVGEEIGHKNTTDFIVSNNTPCDEFYEVLEAMTINPIIVQDVLRRIEKLKKKETDMRKPFDESEFVKALSELKIRSISGDSVRSLFEFPVLYRMTTPVNEYNPGNADLLISTAMTFIRSNILWYIDAIKADLYLSQVIWDQYELFEANLKALEEGGEELYQGYLGDTVTNNVRAMVRNFFYEQGETEKVNTIKRYMGN